MLYRTKVTYRAGGRQYAPGATLPGSLPQADLAFLRERGWLEPVDAAPAALEEPTWEADPECDAKSPDIWKMRSKKEVYAYAQSIGLDLGEGYEKSSMKELQERVADFLEEQMEEGLHEF